MGRNILEMNRVKTASLFPSSSWFLNTWRRSQYGPNTSDHKSVQKGVKVEELNFTASRLFTQQNPLFNPESSASMQQPQLAENKNCRRPSVERDAKLRQSSSYRQGEGRPTNPRSLFVEANEKSVLLSVVSPLSVFGLGSFRFLSFLFRVLSITGRGWNFTCPYGRWRNVCAYNWVLTGRILSDNEDVSIETELYGKLATILKKNSSYLQLFSVFLTKHSSCLGNIILLSFFSVAWTSNKNTY